MTDRVLDNRYDSFNAGYHRGLNSEYHTPEYKKGDIWVYPLFLEWLQETSRDRRFVFSPVFWEFERGYREGLNDFKDQEKE